MRIVPLVLFIILPPILGVAQRDIILPQSLASHNPRYLKSTKDELHSVVRVIHTSGAWALDEKVSHYH